MSIHEARLEEMVSQAVAVEPPELTTPRASQTAQVILIASTPELGQVMQREMALDPEVAGEMFAGTLAQALAQSTVDWRAADFVVFEAVLERDDLRAVRQLKALCRPSMGCIAISQTPVSETTVQRYLEAGVQDLVTVKPVSAPQPAPIEAAIIAQADPAPIHVMQDTPMPIAQPASHNDQAVQTAVFLRARGGAGATTLAVNMAINCAQDSPYSRTALIDLDLQNGVISLALDLQDSAQMTRFIKGEIAADAAFLDSVMQRHDSGLDVLTAPDVFAPLTALTPDMVVSLIDALKARYDHIIIDMPQAIVDWTSPVLESATNVVLVSDMSLPSLKRSKRMIDLISQEHVTLPIKTVINFEKRPMMQSAAHREAADLIGRPLDHWIPDCAKVARRAIDMGVPLSVGAKRSALAKPLKALTEAVFPAQTPRAGEEA
ncbi:MAG: AAA family ATPase [Maritimibacter sp.]